MLVVLKTCSKRIFLKKQNKHIFGGKNRGKLPKNPRFSPVPTVPFATSPLMSLWRCPAATEAAPLCGAAADSSPAEWATGGEAVEFQKNRFLEWKMILKYHLKPYFRFVRHERIAKWFTTIFRLDFIVLSDSIVLGTIKRVAYSTFWYRSCLCWLQLFSFGTKHGRPSLSHDNNIVKTKLQWSEPARLRIRMNTSKMRGLLNKTVKLGDVKQTTINSQ